MGLRQFFAIFPIVMAFSGASAQPAAPLPEGDKYLFTEADCATLVCRSTGGTYKIHTREGTDVSMPIPAWPYVTGDGTIIVFPGENLTFDFPQAGESPGAPRYLAAAPREDTPNILTVSFEYKASANGQRSFLILKQSLPSTVKLDASVSFFTRQGMELKDSSTCPLAPGLVGVEDWPTQLGPILLHNLRFLPAGAAKVCE